MRRATRREGVPAVATPRHRRSCGFTQILHMNCTWVNPIIFFGSSTFCQDVPRLQSTTFSVMNRRPRNYLLPGGPLLRANTFSGMERQPRNYGLQDVTLFRANTFSGTECHPRNYGLPERDTSPSKHVLRDGASAPKLHSAGRATSPSKHVLGDRASAPKLRSAGRATSPSKQILRDGASAPNLHSAGCAPSKHVQVSPHANTCNGVRAQPVFRSASHRARIWANSWSSTHTILRLGTCPISRQFSPLRELTM